jgi:hypothetical protein
MRQTRRRTPTENDLRELLPHICYEVKMLLMTDLLLLREQDNPRDRNSPPDWTIHNALFESHTVHARALFAFFFQGPNKPEDAVASDYVRDWPRIRPKPAAILNTVSPRVGKEIAHLTYGRLAYKTDDERQWRFTEITKALVIVLNQWLEHTPNYVRETLLTYLQDYVAEPEVRRHIMGGS